MSTEAKPEALSDERIDMLRVSPDGTTPVLSIYRSDLGGLIATIDSLRATITRLEERNEELEEGLRGAHHALLDGAKRLAAAEAALAKAEAENERLRDAVIWVAGTPPLELTLCITNESWDTRCDNCEACTIHAAVAALEHGGTKERVSDTIETVDPLREAARFVVEAWPEEQLPDDGYDLLVAALEQGDTES
jgi:hypothetical protein